MSREESSLEQRDVADRERGMRAAEREQAAVEGQCRTGRSDSRSTLRSRQSSFSGSQGAPVVKPAFGVASHGIGVRTGSRPRPRPGSRSSRGSCTRVGGI